MTSKDVLERLYESELRKVLPEILARRSFHLPPRAQQLLLDPKTRIMVSGGADFECEGYEPFFKVTFKRADGTTVTAQEHYLLRDGQKVLGTSVLYSGGKVIEESVPDKLEAIAA